MALWRLARIRKVADQHEQTRKDKELKSQALLWDGKEGRGEAKETKWKALKRKSWAQFRQEKEERRVAKQPEQIEKEKTVSWKNWK